MSIKYKIALLFASLLTLILALVSLFVYFFSVKEREATFITRLKNRALSTARIYADTNDSNFAVLRKLDVTAVSSLYEKSISIAGLSNNHSYLYSDKPGDSLKLGSEIIEHTKTSHEYYFKYGDKKAISIQYKDSSQNFIVAFAARDLDGEDYLEQLKKILLISLFLSVILSYFTGLLFAYTIIKPIKRISGEVNLITSNNLSQRIKLHKAKDELARLAQTFNHLLDHLQESFATQRRFISNASHELSTPLTSVSSQLEVAIQKSRTPEEYRAVIESVYEDIQELQLLTRSLLEIAKTGAEGSIDLNEVRLDEVLFKVVSDVQKQNKEYKVVLNFGEFPEEEKLLTVFGNANLLYMALKNIVDNGCKYAADKQSSIAVLFDKSSVTIRVAGKGDVITESDMQSIFQPFFRAGSAQNKPGFGLGLTLTKQILSLHKGEIHVESNLLTGTVFTIEIPNILYRHE